MTLRLASHLFCRETTHDVTRWAPTSYKWSYYDLVNWSYTLVRTQGHLLFVLAVTVADVEKGVT